MANIKITELDALGAIETNDVLAIVDVNDTAQAPSGSTRKLTIDTLATYLDSNLSFLASGDNVSSLVNDAGYLTTALQNGDVDLGYTASTRTVTNTAGDDTVLPLFTSTEAGLAPLSGGGTTNFLRADGTWAAAGGADGNGLFDAVNNNTNLGVTDVNLSASSFSFNVPDVSSGEKLIDFNGSANTGTNVEQRIRVYDGQSVLAMGTLGSTYTGADVSLRGSSYIGAFQKPFNLIIGQGQEWNVVQTSNQLTSPVKRMTMDDSGRFAFGAAAPIAGYVASFDDDIIVNGSTTSGGLIMRNLGGGGYLSEVSNMAGNKWALYHSTAGELRLNSVAGQTLSLRVGGAAQMTLSALGDFGFGATPISGVKVRIGGDAIVNGDCDATTYSVNGVSGAVGGTFTTITSITVVDGIITAISGS